MLINGSSTVGVCNAATPWSIPLAGTCTSWWWSVAHVRSAVSGCSIHCSEYEEHHATHSSVPQPYNLYGGAYSSRGLAENHPIPLHSLHGGERSSFWSCVPHDDKVNSESVKSVKPGDSGVVIGCQLDQFVCILSVECFIAWSHIYLAFTGKVSTLTHFPLEQGREDYSFLDQAVKDFEHGLDSICTGSVDIPEMEVSFEEADAMPSSVSFTFLCLVSTHSDNCRLQLAPSIKCLTSWCQSRASLLPVAQVGKMSASI